MDADRLTPVAVIPVHTPQEAMEELEYAIKTQGFKAAVISHVQRPVPKILKGHPEVAGQTTFIDLLALDSEYDYDPFWAKCVELKVAVTSHASGQGWGSRRSVSNYMFNHIGHFGDARRFSQAEGGVEHREIQAQLVHALAGEKHDGSSDRIVAALALPRAHQGGQVARV